MKFESKFDFKQKVYAISIKNQSLWIPCTFCNETGLIIGYDQQTFNCPYCHGRRGHKKFDKKIYSVNQPMTIGEVRIKSRCKHRSENKEIFTNYGDQVALYEEEYMCYETGIGSGTVWSLERIFVTEAEAQVACDKLNAEANTKP